MSKVSLSEFFGEEILEEDLEEDAAEQNIIYVEPPSNKSNQADNTQTSEDPTMQSTSPTNEPESRSEMTRSVSADTIEMVEMQKQAAPPKDEEELIVRLPYPESFFVERERQKQSDMVTTYRPDEIRRNALIRCITEFDLLLGIEPERTTMLALAIDVLSEIRDLIPSFREKLYQKRIQFSETESRNPSRQDLVNLYRDFIIEELRKRF